MKTIKGKESQQVLVQESILGSVGLGKDAMIKAWIEKHRYLEGGYIYNAEEGTISFTKDIILSDFDIPLRIGSCGELVIRDLNAKEYRIPEHFGFVKFVNCPRLERVFSDDENIVQGNELVFENCEALTTIDCEAVVVNNVSFVKCPNITTIKGFKNIKKTLSYENCKKLRNYELENVYTIDLYVYRCPLKNFEKPLKANNLTFTNLIKVEKINLPVEQISDILRIEKCSELTDIDISGKNVMDISINDNPELKSVYINASLQNSCTLSNLPKLEETNLPERIRGYYIFKKLPITPKVSGKVITK